MEATRGDLCPVVGHLLKKYAFHCLVNILFFGITPVEWAYVEAWLSHFLRSCLLTAFCFRQEGDAAGGGRVAGVARDAPQRRARVPLQGRVGLRSYYACQVTISLYS